MRIESPIIVGTPVLAADQINDFTEAAQDVAGSTLVAGENVTIVYDDPNNTITISAASGGGSVTTEQIQDVVGAFVTAGTNVTVDYNDAAGTLTISSNSGADAEAVRDIIGATLVAGTNVSIDVNDGADTVTINATNAVSSVNTQTGAVILTAADVGALASGANAVSATKLVTARNINGVAFDGTANITIADSTKEPTITTGTVLEFWRGDKTWQSFATATRASVITGLSVTNSAIVATDTVLAAFGKAQGQINNKLDITGTAAAATKLITARTISGVSFDGTANITLTAADVGALASGANAVSATKLVTARNINGVAFDGTADITVTASVNQPVQTVASSGGTLNLSAVTADTVQVSLTENITTILLPAGVNNFRRDLVIAFTQASPGGRTVAGWPIGTSHNAGVAPTVLSTTGAVTEIPLSNINNSGWRTYGTNTISSEQMVLKVPTTQRQIAGVVNGTALSTLALTANRVFYIPFVAPRRMTLTALGVSVSTLTAGTGTMGVYAADGSASFHYPGTLLATTAVGTINTGSTGTKTGSLSYTLEANTLYFLALVNSSAATVRSVALAGQQTSLGFTDNAATNISYYYAAAANTTLATTALSPTVATALAMPAIYVIE